MLTIRQFRYSSDNLAYIIHGQREAMVIDGGATDEIHSYLSEKGLKLAYVTNTHEHPDHTPGNGSLLEKTGAVAVTPLDAVAKKNMKIEDETIRIFHTPGHSLDSVTFQIGSRIITGDTLFNGTVGNCFTGDLQAFFNSIKKLMSLPGETVVYAGHDYVTYSMAFARIVEPDNSHIDRFLKNYDAAHVFSTLDDEKRINPYVRFNDPDMIQILESKGLPVSTEYERWESIMSLG
jgi:hydroxyacylglutathione hydrolase